MNLLTRSITSGIFGPDATPATQAQDTLWLKPMFVGEKSYTGKQVSPETAINLDAVVACIRLLSETVGAMPRKMFVGEGAQRREARGTWQWDLMHRRPNREMPPVMFWSLVMTHLCSWGNAFLGKEIVGNEIVNLWPIHPEHVQVGRLGGVKTFDVMTNDGIRRYGPDSIIHFAGFSLDGVSGLSPIGMAREAIGAGLAFDEYANRFFSNGAVPVGTLETDETLDEPTLKRLERRWNRKFGGLRNAGRVAVLEQGLKWKSVVLPLKDLEFCAQSELNAKKVARFFRVPASMIDANGGDKSLTYRTVEGDNLQFLIHTVRYWLRLIEQTLELDYDFTPPRSEMYVEHVVDDLLSTETLTRYQAHQIAVGNKPWVMPSDVAQLENQTVHPELDKLALVTPAPQPTSEMKAAGGDREAELQTRAANLERELAVTRERLAAQQPPTVRFERGAIQVDAPHIEAPPAPEVKFAEGAIRVESPTTIEEGAIRVDVAAPTTVEPAKPTAHTITLSNGEKATVEPVEPTGGE